MPDPTPTPKTPVDNPHPLGSPAWIKHECDKQLAKQQAEDTARYVITDHELRHVGAFYRRP